MSDGAERWREAWRSWERLTAWKRSGTEDPLEALSDVGLVRRLLDEAELDAVRSARRRGHSWAEIAIKLGVSRQSAWERWRELDDGPTVQRPERSVPAIRRRVDDRVVGSLVTVPDVVGMPFDDALDMLAEHGLAGVHGDPLGPALYGPEGSIVTGQNPEAGALVRPGSGVTLWTETDGGSGVREPRRPRPSPLEELGYGEPSEEAVG